MATYSGDKAEKVPSLRTEGEVSEPSMTLDGYARVETRDAGSPPPGSSPEFALWVQALEGLYAKLEGGRIDEITKPVTIAGPVTIVLTPAQLAALLPLPFPKAPDITPGIVPGTDPENPIWVASLNGPNNQASISGGRLDGINEAVTVRGSVTALLGDPGTAILGLAADSAAIRALLGQPIPKPDAVFPDELGNATRVDGTVTTQPTVTIARKRTTLIVSTTAVLLAPSDPNRKSLVITNNSTGSLYIGGPEVASSGSTMGILVPTTGGYSDSGDGIFTGELWGIYSASASSHNVVVDDRS